MDDMKLTLGGDLNTTSFSSFLGIRRGNIFLQFGVFDVLAKARLLCCCFILVQQSLEGGVPYKMECAQGSSCVASHCSHRAWIQSILWQPQNLLLNQGWRSSHTNFTLSHPSQSHPPCSRPLPSCSSSYTLSSLIPSPSLT